MSTFKININSNSVVTFTNKLEKLHKSALPIALRNTLNDVAFKMKKTTLPNTAKKTFEQRQANFFKANSKVFPASGFDINTMASTVAMISSGLHNNSTNFAVKDLEQQEHGGTIKGRSFKPMADARIGGKGLTKSAFRRNKLKAGNVILAHASKGANKMQKFIRASIHAGEGGFVLDIGSPGKSGMLWQVKKIKRLGRNTFFTKKKLFSFKKSGVAKVHGTGFMKKSALEVQKEMEFFYKLEAMKQFKKYGVMA